VIGTSELVLVGSSTATPSVADSATDLADYDAIAAESLADVEDAPNSTSRDHIEAFIAHWNDDPTPFIWTKEADALTEKHRQMLERISHAVR
jgi:hypothetical protein